jgi:hypothetical protein
MEAIATAARTHQAVALQTTCERPSVLDPVADAQLIALTPSPFDFDQTGRDH